MALLARLKRDEHGATAVEYALILSLMVIAMIGGLALFADSAIGMWNGVAQNVVEATN